MGYAKGSLQVGQQWREAARIVAISGHPLELYEVAKSIDAVEVDPHPFEGEEASSLGNDHRNPQHRRQGLLELSGLGHLDQPITALLLSTQIQALIGDQVCNCTVFLSQLQPSP